MIARDETENGEGGASFDLSIVLEQRPTTSPWQSCHWEVIGVAVTSAAEPSGERRLISEIEGSRRYISSGYTIDLYKDECESYYHNLLSPNPSCFVIADQEDGGEPPEVLKLSLSFDEAHAYLEGQSTIFAVAIPPELYRLSEEFVIAHYAPEKRSKRKLTDWRQGNSGGSEL